MAQTKQSLRPKQKLEHIRDHSHVDKVVETDYEDGKTTAMVILDWVTDSTVENGTRMIHEKQYDGHIRLVGDFLKELRGVGIRRRSNSGLARYTYHIEIS